MWKQIEREFIGAEEGAGRRRKESKKHVRYFKSDTSAGKVRAAYPISTDSAPSGVTRIGGAKVYAAKLATENHDTNERMQSVLKCSGPKELQRQELSSIPSPTTTAGMINDARGKISEELVAAARNQRSISLRIIPAHQMPFFRYE